MVEAISRKAAKEKNELDDKDYFPLWMRQLEDPLKYNRRLANFGSITEMAEEYLKISIR